MSSTSQQQPFYLLRPKVESFIVKSRLKGRQCETTFGVIFQHCDTFRLAIYWPLRWLPMFFKVIFSYVWPSRNSRVVAQKIAFPIQIASVVPSPDHAILSRSGAEKTVNSRALWPKSQAHKSVQKNCISVLLILSIQTMPFIYFCAAFTLSQIKIRQVFQRVASSFM